MRKRETGTPEKIGILACGVGAVASFIWLHWILGVLMIVGGGYLFVKLMKIYAETGRRF